MPEAFVVGRDGKISWIGHPMHDESEDTLDRAIERAIKVVPRSSPKKPRGKP